jgi:TRAP-type C4-dicarboxylate transport system permease small subunit
VVQRERQQIVVEVLTHRLPPRALAFVECFACILTAAFVGGLAWAGMLEAIDQTMAGETTNSTSARFAVWPTRWFPVVGYLGTFIYLSIQSVRAIGAAARRGPSE